MSRKTPVRFYWEHDAVLAVFTADQQMTTHGAFHLCYTLLGQHAHSYAPYHSRLPLATPAQYRQMAAHLTAIGYNLRITREP